MADKPISVNVEGVGVVNFPANFTPERIKFAIENDILPRLKAKPEQDFSAPEAPTARESFGRGMVDVGQGVQQGAMQLRDKIEETPLLKYNPVMQGARVLSHLIGSGRNADEYTKEKTAEVELYEKGRKNGSKTLSNLVAGTEADPGIDWWRMGGNVAATLPAMAIPGGSAATLPVRMASGAGQGAASSSAMFTPEGQSKGAQTATGAVVGGLLPASVDVVRKVGGGAIDKLRPMVMSVDDSPNGRLAGELSFKLQQQGIDFRKLTGEVQSSLLADAKKAVAVGGTLDDAMLNNKALIESIGAKPTRASVSRAPRDWQAEKNMRGIQGVGEPILEREQSNAMAMVDYLGKLRAASGGKATTPLEAGESAIGALQAQDNAKKEVVKKLYDAFRGAGMNDVEVPAAKIADRLGTVADEIGVENIPGAVMSRLKEFGLMGGKQTKLLTVNEADKLNRLINNNNPGRGTPGAKALQPIKQALDEALLDVAPNAKQGVDALMEARAAHAARMTEQKAGKGITAAIEDVSPDRFVKRFVFDADVRDLRAMKAELLKSEAGIQAMKDVKGHLLDTMLLKSTGATAADDVLGKPFSGVKFGKALDSIPPEKLHLLFTPDELGALRTLQKASKLLTEEVPFSDVNHSKTAAALANLLQKIGNTPILGQIVSPIIGTGKIGMEWVKDANARKQVAEALLGSAGKSAPRALPPPSPVFGMLPGPAGAVAAEPRDRPNK